MIHARKKAAQVDYVMRSATDAVSRTHAVHEKQALRLDACQKHPFSATVCFAKNGLCAWNGTSRLFCKDSSGEIKDTGTDSCAVVYVGTDIACFHEKCDDPVKFSDLVIFVFVGPPIVPFWM